MQTNAEMETTVSDVVELAHGPYAVVVPVDPGEPPRVIFWSAQQALAILYREIGCTGVDLRVVGEPGVLGVWVDDEGVFRPEWAANGRAAWLARVVGGSALLVAGTVVLTLAEPDADGDTRGLSRASAERLAGIVAATPVHDVEALTALLREVVDRGPILMTLDENNVPDGFVI